MLWRCDTAALNAVFPDDGGAQRGDDVDPDGGAEVGLHQDLRHVRRQHRAGPRHAGARAQAHRTEDRWIHLDDKSNINICDCPYFLLFYNVNYALKINVIRG